MIANYFLQNWTLILILLAFTATLRTTVFLDRKTIDRMYVLIVLIFLLSICVYVAFLPGAPGVSRSLRLVLMAIRYSATPFIIAQVIYTLVKKFRPFIFVPAILLALLNNFFNNTHFFFFFFYKSAKMPNLFPCICKKL